MMSRLLIETELWNGPTKPEQKKQGKLNEICFWGAIHTSEVSGTVSSFWWCGKAGLALCGKGTF